MQVVAARAEESCVRHPTNRGIARLLIIAVLGAMLPLIAAGAASAAKVKTIKIADASIVEGNAGTSTLSFKVTWSGSKGGGGSVSVDYATAAATATAGSDYTTKTGTVSLTNGACRCGTISIAIVGDLLDEDTETFQVNLSNPSGATIADAQAIGTIYDNEGPPAVIVTDASDVESTGSMSVSVLLTGATAGTVTMDYVTATGTAVEGSDFTTTTGSLTFTSPQTSKTVPVPITSDALNEDDETFTLTVSNVVGASVTANTGTATIVDDDAEPDLSIANATVIEGNSGTLAASFAVTLSAASGREISVDYATADGTASTGSDYTASTGTLVFAAGETSGSVDVPVLGDTAYEGNETFAVSLSSPSNAGIADADAVGTITDDDTKPSFSIDDVSVAEGNAGTATATFTVSMSNPSAAGASVQWATSDGSAVAGSDYEAGGATLSFAAGAVSRTVDVTIDGDTVDEADETFGLTLSSPTGATISDGSGTGTIDDDDKTPTVLTLKPKKTTRSLKATGVIEAATTGMKVKVTLSKKKGAKYVKVATITVTVTKLGDRDVDGVADAAYAAAFKRPKKGAYRIVAKYAGNSDYLACSKKLSVKI
jgi:large repetitive protein